MADKPSKRFRCPPHWTLAQRLDHYTDKSGGPDACWPWTGYRTSKGYGHLRWKGRLRSATRLTWEEENGPIPVGLQVCHRCDNPPCRNKAHLWLDTNAANRADMVAKGRSVRGERHRSAKLTAEQVISIRASSDSNSAIARRLGMNCATISAIRLRKKWKHI